jgi:2-keto-myo-inositol isomerase
MTTNKVSRRAALARAAAVASAAVAAKEFIGLSAAAAPQPQAGSTGPFLFCLNTATIRGQKLGIVKEIEVAAQAGYDAIEPWVDGVDEYVKSGGTLSDLRKRIADSGLTVEGAISFPEWVVNDEARREKGMERAKREMEMVAQIGGKRFAAPPAGATDLPRLDLLQAAERYRRLLDIGREIGVVPELELWGFSKNLNRLSECVAVAMETGHPSACVLIDIFHLYKGGSDFHAFHLLGPDAVQVLHMNDFPADPPREKIDDSYRIFPGDGSAPLTQTLRALHKTGGQKVLSLELFSRKYWAGEPLAVVKSGLAKMKAAAEKALA